MGHFKLVLLCFILAGILISRPSSGRPVITTVRTVQHIESENMDPASLVPAESPEGSEHGGEQAVHTTEKHHHSSDIAGGGVIIGGLVTVTFAAIFCYIRVTRKRDGEKH
uniref:uncharacterized protein LOC122610878 n=1 Tax=Erigeron canadensis TaxID=72917 RepID=UPI001CB8B58F|nr:uncharacterized protein LOC122610878 [Erigeron canadensis]